MSLENFAAWMEQLGQRMKDLQRKLDDLEEAAAHVPEGEMSDTQRALLVSILRGVLEGEVSRWQKIALGLAALLGLSLLALVIVLVL